jgi:hypothetical protein
MAINKNHEFEELNGVKCAIVEKNVSQERTDFLNDLLKANNYTVVIVPSPLPKAAPTAAAPAENDVLAAAPAPATFTVGVTDVTFNPINAIFGRLLKTLDRRVVTLAFWQQKETLANDDIPYFENEA